LVKKLINELFDFLLSPGLPNKKGDIKPFKVFWILFITIILIAMIGEIIGLNS
jgi:hypothetical protein